MMLDNELEQSSNSSLDSSSNDDLDNLSIDTEEETEEEDDPTERLFSALRNGWYEEPSISELIRDGADLYDYEYDDEGNALHFAITVYQSKPDDQRALEAIIEILSSFTDPRKRIEYIKLYNVEGKSPLFLILELANPKLAFEKILVFFMPDEQNELINRFNISCNEEKSLLDTVGKYVDDGRNPRIWDELYEFLLLIIDPEVIPLTPPNAIRQKEQIRQEQKKRAYIERPDNLANLDITDDDIIEIITSFEQTKPKISAINLANNRITSTGLERLKIYIISSDSIFSVKLDGNPVEEDVVKKFNHYIGPTYRLQRLMKHFFDHALDIESGKIKGLIESGAYIDVKINDGHLIHSVVQHGDIDLLEYLTTKNCDIKAKNNSKQSVLNIAVSDGRTDILSFLLKRYKNLLQDIYPPAESKEMSYPLNQAAKKGDLTSVQIFLNAGAELEYLDETTETPLVNAAESSHYEIVKLLIKRGACINNERLKSLREDNDELNQILSAQEEKESQLYTAASHGDISTAQRIIQEGVNVNCKDKDGNTPLNKAAIHKQLEMCAFLLQHGADRSIAKSFKVLSEEDKNKIGIYSIRYLKHSTKAITAHLITHTKITDSKHPVSNTPKIEAIYEDLYGMDDEEDSFKSRYLRPIMDIVSTIPEFQIIYDPTQTNVSKTEPTRSEETRGTCIYEELENGKYRIEIHVSGKRDYAEVMGTVIHEMAHIACRAVWNNAMKPYALQSSEQEEFKAIHGSLKKIYDGSITEEKLDPLISEVFKYIEDAQHCELIVRIPQIIARFETQGLTILREQEQHRPLLNYYENKVLPEFNKFLLNRRHSQNIEISHSSPNDRVENNESGLSEEDAAKRLQQFFANMIVKKISKPIKQFNHEYKKIECELDKLDFSNALEGIKKDKEEKLIPVIKKLEEEPTYTLKQTLKLRKQLLTIGLFKSRQVPAIEAEAKADSSLVKTNFNK